VRDGLGGASADDGDTAIQALDLASIARPRELAHRLQ
jgi:hypothetical protein